MNGKIILLQADSTRFQEKREAGESGAVESDLHPSSFFENQVWLTSAEAACYLRKSVGALRAMVCRKQIPCRKFYRRLYFKRSELDHCLEASFKGGQHGSV